MWDQGLPGVLDLPSGRRIRGRGLRSGTPPGPDPEFGVYLLGKPPAATVWASAWIRWPDFRLPTDREQARKVLQETLARAEEQRVEIACAGGRGRTGTALACLAVLDGVPRPRRWRRTTRILSPRRRNTLQRRFVERYA